jgi:hypothetical protein
MATLIYYTNGYGIAETFPTLDEALSEARSILSEGRGYVYSVTYAGKTYARPEPNGVSELDRLLWPEKNKE